MGKLKVAINAQILPNGGTGGVVQATIGLIRALGQLNASTDEYVVIGHWEGAEWLEPYVGAKTKLVRAPKSQQQLLARIAHRLGPLRPIASKAYGVARGIVDNGKPHTVVATSTGFYESLDCEVIHFPYQRYVKCDIPTAYNPHDLQHLHYPYFFTSQQIDQRELEYQTGCNRSHTVVVASQWVKQDIIEHYHIAPSKIQVIPWAPTTQFYTEPTQEYTNQVAAKYEIDSPFALYPAMTWPHKNHIRLLEALEFIRRRWHCHINLVCTGHQNTFWPQIQKVIRDLKLQRQVKFLGMIPPQDLRVLYRLARFAIIPSLFEAASAPMFEAWHDGTPVACSNVTSLPEQAQDAALLFDPSSVESIANALERMTMDAGLLDTLQQHGYRRLQDFSWERTARAYRAVYRRAAGVALNDEDAALLSWDWMANPRQKQEVHA